MDDKRIKYFPFRDDVQLIMKEYVKFANELVCSIYSNRKYSKKFIGNDRELQSWANELSLDGNHPNGVSGKVDE